MLPLITIGKGLYLTGSFAICSHALAKDARRIGWSSEPLTPANKRKTYHNIAALGFAISSIAFFRFQILSDLLNGAYYSTRLSSESYEKSRENNCLGIPKHLFFFFGAAASTALLLGSAGALPGALLLVVDVAGTILAGMETGIFLHTVQKTASEYLMPATPIKAALLTL